MKKIRAIILGIWALCACGCASTEVNHQSQQQEAAEANVKLGMYYLLEKNNAAQAKQKFLKAMTQAPSDPMVWYSLAYFEERVGEINAARIHYIHAIKLSPRSGATQNNYAAFLCRQGEYQQSIGHFINATKDPYYVNTAKAYENAAQCAAKIPDKVLAEKYHQLAKERGLEVEF
jgi:type IV pilus assembly protein PilF